MKLKYLFLLCISLLLTGCFGEAEDGVAHYRFGNKTNDIIRVFAYDVDDDGRPVRIEHSFELSPGEEYEITYAGPMGLRPYPFNYSSYINLSNSELEVVFYWKSPREDEKYLFQVASYEVVKEKKSQIWYRYDFTDLDFQRGVPIQ